VHLSMRRFIKLLIFLLLLARVFQLWLERRWLAECLEWLQVLGRSYGSCPCMLCVRTNDSEVLCLVWREIFFLKELEFRAKAFATRNRFMPQFSSYVLIISTEQVLCGEIRLCEVARWCGQRFGGSS
jgi:hypothetical protein